MPKFYHVHRTATKSAIEKGFKSGKALFFSKKNSFWFQFEKEIGMSDYNGYIIYEIDIPYNFYTYSFNPISKNKIVKINKHNVKEYKRLVGEYKGQTAFREEMTKRNIIGIDATWLMDTKAPKGVIIVGEEGYIWEKPDGIKITFYEKK